MIVVYGIKENLNPIKAKLSDVIHSCMQSVLGLPEDKRAHRFVPLDKKNFYDIFFKYLKNVLYFVLLGPNFFHHTVYLVIAFLLIFFFYNCH